MKKTFIKVIGVIIIGIIAIVMIYPKHIPVIDYKVDEVHLDRLGFLNKPISYDLDKDKVNEFIDFLNDNIELNHKIEDSNSIFLPEGGTMYIFELKGQKHEQIIFVNGYYMNDKDAYLLDNYKTITDGIDKYFD